MTTQGQNFEVYQGDNKEIIITVRNKYTGALEDLTGYSAVWCAYNQTLANVVILKVTTDGGIVIPTPTSGELHIILDSEDTADLVPTKNYGHQCEIEDALGNHSTVATGYMKVARSITHNEL